MIYIKYVESIRIYSDDQQNDQTDKRISTELTAKYKIKYIYLVSEKKFRNKKKK